MFNPNCENLEVRVRADLPPDCGGGVMCIIDGVRWVLVTPRTTTSAGLPEWIGAIDPPAWKEWALCAAADGEPVTAIDLAGHFDIPLEVAVWGFQQYVGDALLRMAALAA